jgi:tetratricopeptide (TPR) repeat protein
LLSWRVLWRLLKTALSATAAAALVWAAFRLSGRSAGLVTLAAVVGVAGASLVWLPRAAHRAFGRGSYGRAALLYRIVGACRLDRDARASVEVSLAACALATERWDEALRRLGRVEPARLPESTRAAWLNNHAYALARSGRDPAAALDASDEAVALRPDVVGFRHTRGVALLALGRTGEAIRELDALWADMAGGEAPPLLEAERCYDLGVAWQRAGERDYATDYFDRARRAAPASTWATRAAAKLSPTTPARLAELLE